MSKRHKSDIEEFIALPDSEKQRIVRKIEAETPDQRLARSRPLNARERAQWQAFRKKMGRPVVGKGAKTISLTVERDLLRRADEYARQHGISRSKLVARGLQAVLDSAADGPDRSPVPGSDGLLGRERPVRNKESGG